MTYEEVPESPVSYEDVEEAASRLEGHAERTPVFTSRTVEERTGSRVFFECEDFQQTGAFKFRGAFNALSRLPAEQQRRGVLAARCPRHTPPLVTDRGPWPSAGFHPG